MCGIIGILSFGGHQSNETGSLSIGNYMGRLEHRGPNSQNSVKFETSKYKLELGHTRLSILDVSNAGMQPMSHRCKGLHIVYNGEVYNYIELRDTLTKKGYRFSSDSDTEVILCAYDFWGENVLKKLKGMFAFSIYDSEKEQLFCARDSFGIKPFYYLSTRGRFTFASEIYALPKDENLGFRPNWNSCLNYLLWGKSDYFDESFYDGVRQLPPGHFLKIDFNSGFMPKIHKWYKPPLINSHTLSYDQSVEKLRDIFLSNVKIHMRSDVKIGAALSGGIDSSSIVCAMRHLEPSLDINTFTYCAADEHIDEGHWANIVSDFCRPKFNQVRVSYTDFESKVLELIKLQGEPFGSTSIFAQYFLYRAAEQQDVRVILDGQGADEALAGYDGYPHARLSSLISDRKFIEAIQFLNSWSEYNSKEVGLAIRPVVSAYIGKYTSNILRAIKNGSTFPSWINKKFLKDNSLSGDNNKYWFEGICWHRGRLLSETLNASLNGTNGMTDLLRYQDRNSMAHSIESRVPFLTRELTDFSTYLPEEYLLSKQGRTKSIFRDAMRDIVPSEILDRRDKIGFETPERGWIQRYIINHLSEIEQGIEDIPILDKGQCIDWLKSTVLGSRKSIWQAWRIVNFIYWYNINFTTKF